jgi:hypothetical protein
LLSSGSSPACIRARNAKILITSATSSHPWQRSNTTHRLGFHQHISAPPCFVSPKGPRSGTLPHSRILLKTFKSRESASWSYKEPLILAGLLQLPDIP